LALGPQKEVDFRVLVYAVGQELIYLLLKRQVAASFKVFVAAFDGWAVRFVAPRRCRQCTRLLNPFGFAAGQLAVFQGGPSRTGGGDEHI
jgi:hypothetical protein